MQNLSLFLFQGIDNSLTEGCASTLVCFINNNKIPIGQKEVFLQLFIIVATNENGTAKVLHGSEENKMILLALLRKCIEGIEITLIGIALI